MKLHAVLSALALVAIASPAYADPDASQAPFKITCIVASSDRNILLVPGVSRTNGVTVMLENTSSKTATAVTVTGSYHGYSVTDTFKAKFEPNVAQMVTRSYTPQVYQGPNAECKVTHVEYADGSTWPEK